MKRAVTPRRSSVAQPRAQPLARLLAWGLVLLALSAPGCASWRGARLYQTGSAALEAGELDRALADLGEAARLVPQGSEIQNHLGLAWQASGDDARALAAFERAVALDCDNHAAVQNLARVDARLKRSAVDRVSGSSDVTEKPLED